MDAQTLKQVFAKLQFSAAMPDRIIQQLSPLATLRHFPAGTLIFREGALNDQLMIVAAGLLALEMYVPGRGEVRIMSLGPGDLLAWSALLADGWMTTSAVTLEDAQIVCIEAAGLRSLCQSDPQIGYHLMRGLAHALANRLVATRLQLLDLFADTATVPSGPD